MNLNHHHHHRGAHYGTCSALHVLALSRNSETSATLVKVIIRAITTSFSTELLNTGEGIDSRQDNSLSTNSRYINILITITNTPSLHPHPLYTPCTPPLH